MLGLPLQVYVFLRWVVSSNFLMMLLVKKKKKRSGLVNETLTWWGLEKVEVSAYSRKRTGWIQNLKTWPSSHKAVTCAEAHPINDVINTPQYILVGVSGWSLIIFNMWVYNRTLHMQSLQIWIPGTDYVSILICSNFWAIWTS